LAKASGNLRDATTLAVDTGVRPNSELFSLKWSDVDLTARPESPHGVIHVRQGKSDATRRSVPLTPRAAEVLRRRKKEAEAEPKPKPKPKPKQSDYVFPGDGNSGHIVSLQHPHEDAVRNAKLESFEFYCWRHTGCAVWHGSLQPCPAHGPQFARRGRPLLCPCHRDTCRCWVWEVRGIPDAQRCGRNRSRVSRSKRSHPVGCFVSVPWYTGWYTEWSQQAVTH